MLLNRKKPINVAGNILMVLSFAFIIDRIIKYKIDFYSVFSAKLFLILGISIITYAVVVLIMATMYETLLRVLWEKAIIKGSTIYIYCKSNLYKYLPGNIFHYVGRNQIAVDEGILHRVVISATIAEMLLLVVAGVISALAFAGHYAISWLLDNNTLKLIIMTAIVILIASSMITILYRINGRAKESIDKCISSIRPIRSTVFLKFIIVYLTTFILNGIMFIVLLYGIGGNPGNALILPIIGMYSFSWIIGFITPGAPAGLGIREAIMSALLFGIVDENIVITSVLFFRVVTIFGDVLGFLVASYINKALNKG